MGFISVVGGVFWSCYKYTCFGSGFKKKKAVSLICCNDGVLSALCHFLYPSSGITYNQGLMSACKILV